MNTTTNPLTHYQQRHLADRAETMERAFKILNGGRALGLDMLGLDVLGFHLWDDPENPSGSIVAYAHKDAKTSLEAGYENQNIIPRGPIFTVLRRDEDHEPIEHLLLLVGTDMDTGREVMYLLDRAEAEVLSPADTALELTEEDVRPLERVASMYAPLQVPAEYSKESDQGGTLPFLKGILDEIIHPWGHGIKENGTLYVVADEVGNVKAIRPDGTILPVGHSLNDADDELDGEREEIIRPRLEELREGIEKRREEVFEQLTESQKKTLYGMRSVKDRKVEPWEVPSFDS